MSLLFHMDHKIPDGDRLFGSCENTGFFTRCVTGNAVAGDPVHCSLEIPEIHGPQDPSHVRFPWTCFCALRIVADQAFDLKVRRRCPAFILPQVFSHLTDQIGR